MASTEGKPDAIHLLREEHLDSGPPATGSWECRPNYRPTRYILLLLKYLADLTGTTITYDEDGNKFDVSGKDEAVVQQTVERVVNLHTALSLLTPAPKTYQHHMFLPPVGYDKLQIIPFQSHSAAATVKTLATSDEWTDLIRMGVLVPFRPRAPTSRSKRDKTPAAQARPAVASRFLANQSFEMFGNYDMYNKPAATSDGPSSASVVERVAPSPERPGPALALRPKQYYANLALENADRVNKWVNKAAEPGTSLADPQQSVPPEEYPPEQKPVKGVLKRRVRQTPNSSPVKNETQAGEEKRSDEVKDAPPVPFNIKSSPTLHRTMGQKTSLGSKSPLKQATLDKYWTKASVASKKKEVEKATPVYADSHEVLVMFNGLQPILEAARSFPGTLEMEVNIKLLTMAPMSPDSGFNEAVVTLDEWKERFQSTHGIPLAPYWAWDKVSGSGADVDAMIDMIWSKKDPRRVFQETPEAQDVVFEYHCRVGDRSKFVISLDKAGHPSFHKTLHVLGCSTIHCPHRMWDLGIALKGEMTLHEYKEPALKVAIDEFVETIHFQPGEDLIIFCSEPQNEMFRVEKILMKSTILHKHIPVDEKFSELMLKTVEVRQFVTGRKPDHPRLIRGRIPVNSRQESVAAKKLWYEVSVVSGAIQKLLTANTELELGQETKKWTSEDLLGDEIDVKDIRYESSKNAQSVGSSGMGSMYRLGKVILERMRIGEPV